MKPLLIQNISQIFSPIPGRFRHPDITVLCEKGLCIYAEEGIIRYVGSYSKIPFKLPVDLYCLDAGGRCVIPGFVDSHTHLLFAGNRSNEFTLRASGATYREIAAKGGGIAATVNAVRQTPEDKLYEIGLSHLNRALANGITTIEIKSGYGLDSKNELKMLRVINRLKEHHPVTIFSTFLGAHAVPAVKDKADYIQELYKMMPRAAKLANFCDVFCDEGYFSAEESLAILQAGKKNGLIPKIHTNQFNSIGGIETALSAEAISADHLEVCSGPEIKQLATGSTVATVLPGVSLYLNLNYAPARKLMEAGTVVAIASDFNPGSSKTLSTQLLQTLACTQMGLTPAQALCCVTQNGARALGMKQTGCIHPGYFADLLILDTDNYVDMAADFGENHIQTVVKNGRAV